MGNIGLGFLYLLFSWTGIPAIIGWVEGIIYLNMGNKDFNEKYIK
jgi:TM2 domain-containing membrane protein YozV